MSKPASIALILTMLCSPAHAQSILTLENCLTLASANNPVLHIVENALRAADLSLSELRTTALPQLRMVGAASYTPLPPSFGYDPAISNGGEVAGQVVLRQSLFDAGVRGLKSDQLQIDLERLVKERRLAHEDLVLAVKQAFVEGLRAQEEVTLQQQSLHQLQAYHDLVQRLYRGGSASYTDLLKTEVQTTGAEIALEKAATSSSSSRLKLAELIGTSIDSAARLAGSLATMVGMAPDTSGARADTGATLDMTIAGLIIRRSLVEHDLASNERLPEISLVADAGWLTSGENLRLPPGERFHSLGYSIGIGIELPILNWGATGFRIQQRELATDDLRQRQEALRRSLATDTQNSRIQLSKARGRLNRLRSNVTKAEENYLLTKSKYAAGATSSLEVLSAQQMLTETRLSELQTLAEIQNLAARIERLTVQ